jgi:hypothetical protein
MNKYLELAIRQKLKDNNIEINELFNIDGWHYNPYLFDGENIMDTKKTKIQDNIYNTYNILNDDFIKIIKIDENARKFFNGIDLNIWKYITEEEGGHIRIFTNKPLRNGDSWSVSRLGASALVTNLVDSNFDFLSYKDNEPTLIKDLL